MDELSNNFKSDFRKLIAWCGEHRQNIEYKRVMLGMSPEPYGIPQENGASAPTETQLLDHVEKVIGTAWDSWQWLYERLADRESRAILLIVLAYRSIGWRYVPMPLDNPKFWQMLTRLAETENTSGSSNRIDAGSMGITLSKFDLSKYGFNIQLFSDAFGVFNEFIYSQYVYRGRDMVLEPQVGDHIIDCGACFGGTTLYFANQVGPAGKVLSFEFFPENVNVFLRNRVLNSALAPRIELIQAPVWSDDGLVMTIEGTGPATQVYPLPNKSTKPSSSFLQRLFGPRRTTDKPNVARVTSTTIDKEVEQRGYDRVDLIKMDIEGAEYSALHGARQTIERFRPILAICVYHKLIDFYEIPQFIDSLRLGYKFYLQHSTVHGDETVLFAAPER